MEGRRFIRCMGSTVDIRFEKCNSSSEEKSGTERREVNMSLGRMHLSQSVGALSRKTDRSIGSTEEKMPHN